MGLLEGPPHTLPACCSPVGRLGPIALNVGLQGDGEPLLQLVHHAALHHPWAVWRGGKTAWCQQGHGAKTRSVWPREGQLPANHLPEPEAPRQGTEGSPRRVRQPTKPRRSQPGAPFWPCNECGQGHRLGPSLGRAGVGLPPPPATAEGVQASQGQGPGGREWPGRTGGVLTRGEEGDGLHQHVFLLMKLQLLQPVVELQHGLQEKLLEATCMWV